MSPRIGRGAPYFPTDERQAVTQHAIHYAGERWLGMVDPGGPQLNRAPVTANNKRMDTAPNEPPVFSVPGTWPNLLQFLATFPQALLTPDARRRSDELAADRMTWATETLYTPPQGCVPYPWQAAAGAQYPRSRRLMLSDEPGTGKTISAILGIMEAEELGDWEALPVLVIAPAGVVSPWVDAFKKWAPVLNVSAYMGPKRRLPLDDLAAGGMDVLVTSYETANRSSADLLSAPPSGVWGTVVLDEHHLIKSQGAKRSLTARKLTAKARGRITLSGTPMTHNAADLWPTLNALEPDSFPSRERYVSRYLDTVEQDYGEPDVLGFLPHRRDEFDLSLAGVHRRVAKLDALPWLPPKVYQLREVELPKEWRKLYNDMRDEMVAELPDNDEPMNAMSVLTQINFLQSLGSAPCDVEVDTKLDDEGMEVKHYHAVLKPESWKVTELLAVMDERPGQSFAVFSQSRQLIELAAMALADRGVEYAKVVGGQSRANRDANVADFQSGAVSVVLVTTQAGGVGITLTAPSAEAGICAVFLSRPWSIVDATQAEDRVHRIGSEAHDSVDIVDIVATNTIDQAIRRRLMDKAAHAADFLNDPRIVRDLLGGKL